MNEAHCKALRDLDEVLDREMKAQSRLEAATREYSAATDAKMEARSELDVAQAEVPVAIARVNDARTAIRHRVRQSS